MRLARIPSLILMAASLLSTAAAADCGPGLRLQVLGSGGPEATGRRAGSGYLVWIDARARVLVDAGSGTSLRFGASGARFEDLDLVAITHLHTDHVAELPSLLKSGYFADRTRPLALAGPSGAGDFPPLEDFLTGLFGPGQGASATSAATWTGATTSCGWSGAPWTIAAASRCRCTPPPDSRSPPWA